MQLGTATQSPLSMSLRPVTLSESRAPRCGLKGRMRPQTGSASSCCVRSTIPAACFLVIFDSGALIGSICEPELTRESEANFDSDYRCQYTDV
jgi:hypothetical protein